VAGDEHEPQHIIADVIVDQVGEVWRRRLAVRCTPEIVAFAIQALIATELIDCAAFCYC